MTELERRLLEGLIELEDAARAAVAPPKPPVLPILEKLDALASRLPPDTDPALVHYLRKKSYEKARLWLQGRNTENQAGSCGHVD